MKILKRFFPYSFYLLVFLLPWQVKLILWPAGTNFQEISIYASQLVLILVLVSFTFYKMKDRGFSDRMPAAWYFLAGLELFIFFSFFFAPDKVLAFYGYIVILLGLGLFYLLKAGTDRECYEDSYLDKIKIIYSFLFSMFLQAILGIYQFLSQSSFANKYLGLAEHDPQTLGTSVIETVSGRWLRAYGGLDHPNIFGGVLAIALLLAAYLLAKKKIINSVRELFESIFLFIFYFFALFAFFFTFSRGAWIAFAVGAIFLLINLIIQADRWVIGRYLAVIFFSAVLLLFVIIPYRDLVMTRATAIGRLEQKSLVERREYLVEAKNLIQKNWLFGVGVGNYTTAVEKSDQIKKDVWDYQPVHNAFLVLWAQSGIFAFLFFLSFLIFLIKKDRREIFSLAIFAALIVLMLFDHWLISLPFGVLFLFFALGLI